ncbi:MAG: lytic transglycosylase domain-containing protein [Nitrospira sp.]|nr:MAG: lytic transglycosylase domain-containing protein [Nitrospira sp.]
MNTEPIRTTFRPGAVPCIALTLALALVASSLMAEPTASTRPGKSAPDGAHAGDSPTTGAAALTGQPEVADENGTAPETLYPSPESEERLVIIPEIERAGQRHFLSSFKLPERLWFAGQAIPLDNWQVRERVEYEFYQFLAEEGESIIMAKRMGRCFPPVEKQLAEAGLPDDLKFMLLVESKCIAAAYSRAKASGPWQFISSTGKRYQLNTTRWRDDRRNLEMSTDAAIKFLRHLNQEFGDWFLAMAAYNAGDGGIRRLLKEQRVNDYWRLSYVRETMRYVPRIIAAKEIYSQPEKYLGLSKKDLYAPLETETVTVAVKEAQRHLSAIAQDYGSYFLELRLLNPEIKTDSLPKGNHQLKVPKQQCPDRCFKQDRTP